MILLSSSFNSFIQLAGVFVIFVFVLVITYFTTKWIGNYQQTSLLNKNLKIVESLRVGNNKSIAMIRAGKSYLVVAVGKDEVTLLTELTEEQLTEVPTFFAEKNVFSGKGKVVHGNFQEIFEKVKEHFPKK